MITTDAQVRRLMKEMQRHGNQMRAALRAGMDRKTARRYLRKGVLPSQSCQARTWRTREDPFEEHWAEVVGLLEGAPDLRCAVVFEELLRRYPGRYQEGQLRTLQRRVRQWRAECGPAKEVFFVQEHQPGEALQTDFTSTSELGITIAGEPFDHLLCHPVLPYSNWEWVTVCLSESMAALRRGLQSALFRLGRVPRWHQTDNSTAATHDVRSGKRTFNAGYEAMCRHFGMRPRTTGIGKKEQNGDVESLHGALKRDLEQQLLLCGSRDFASREEYERWLWEQCERRNRRRQKRLEEELALMGPLPSTRLPEYQEISVAVGWGSTIRIKSNTYSVPARLIGESVKARVYDERIEIHYAGRLQHVLERLLGKARHRIDYRHVIHSLVRKPWAFRRYRYREDLFPSRVFRRAYDRLVEKLQDRRADLEYLRLLQLAADHGESAVEALLEELLEASQVPHARTVRERLEVDEAVPPALAVPAVDLTAFDALLSDAAEVA